MPVVPYRSPDEAAFVVFDKARFRVEHGIFYLRVGPLCRELAAVLEAHAGWNLEFMKLVEHDRRVRACLEWLESLPDDTGQVHPPDFVHEPALDVVANALIGRREYDRVDCPACVASYPADQIRLDPWEFEEEGVTLRGRASTCPGGHTVHVLTDVIDDLEIEVEGD